MSHPQALLTKCARNLGRVGQGVVLFILLSLSIIFFFYALGTREPSDRAEAPGPAGGRAGQSVAPKPSEIARSEDGRKFAAPVEAPAPAAPPPSVTTAPSESLKANPQASVTTAPAAMVAPAPSASPPAATSREVSRCPFADPERRLVTVKEEVPARAAPSVTSRTLQDKSGAHRAFDPRADLELLESRLGWVRLRYTPPRWPPGQKAWEGWTMENVIRPAHHTPETMTADERACLFIDPASWRGVAPALQSKIRDAALRILREDERCRLIGDGGMMGETRRFYLTCYPSDGGQPYHYWLSAASSDKDFATPAPVDESVAMELCRKKLEKMLVGMGAAKGAPVPEVSAGAISSFKERSAYYMTLDYHLGEALENQAYCFVPPGRDAEITLRDTP